MSSNQSLNTAENESYSDLVLKLIAKSINDLNEVSTRSNYLIIPFDYLPKQQLKHNSLLLNHNFDDSNFNMKSLVKTSCFYYSNINDCNNENDHTSSIVINEKSKIELKHHLEMDYFYHNCLADSLLKLYSRTLSEKFLLAKYLVNLMPYNCDLIMCLVNFSKKIHGVQKTLQFLYDHVCVHSIENEKLVSV